MKRNILYILSLCVFLVISPEAFAQRTIKTVEYWTDAGFTERSQLALTASTLYNWEELIDASALKDGVHTFNARFQDDSGVWTSVHSYFFLKQTHAAGQQTVRKINMVEYWTDAGSTERSQLALTASTLYNWEELIDASALKDGVHTFNARFQDDSGVWTSVHSYFFLKQTHAAGQ